MSVRPEAGSDMNARVASAFVRLRCVGWPWQLATMSAACRRCCCQTPSSSIVDYSGRTARLHDAANACGGDPRHAVPALDPSISFGIAIGLPLGLLTSTSEPISRTTIRRAGARLQTLPMLPGCRLAHCGSARPNRVLFVVVMGTVVVLLATDGGLGNIPPIYSRPPPRKPLDRKNSTNTGDRRASLPYVVSGMKHVWAFAWRSMMAPNLLHDPDGFRGWAHPALRRP